MSTNGMSSWAVDLKDVGAIYPFQGWEMTMFIIGLVFWIGWHIIQLKQEADEVKREQVADPSGEKTNAHIDRY